MKIFRIEHKDSGFGFFTAHNRMGYDKKYHDYIAKNKSLFLDLDFVLAEYPNLPSDEANELGIHYNYTYFLDSVNSVFGCLSLEQLKSNWVNTLILNLLKKLDFVLVEYRLISTANTYLSLKTQTVFNINKAEKINIHSLDILYE